MEFGFLGIFNVKPIRDVDIFDHKFNVQISVGVWASSYVIIAYRQKKQMDAK